MKIPTLAVLAASAFIALAAWPAFVARQASEATASARPTPAPVMPDYRDRDRIVAFLESRVKADPANQILPRMLAQQYLQRYREHGDLGDVLRAEDQAQHSLREQSRQNIGAETTLATVYQTLHRFHDAAPLVDAAYRSAPWNSGYASQRATIAMELGEYPAAGRILSKLKPGQPDDASAQTAQSRYDELTGRLAEAKQLLRSAMIAEDAIFDAPAEARAWYHFRMGELAFASGDPAAAMREERIALERYPVYARAYNVLARVDCAQHRWSEALEAATKGADLVPLPETLGYKEDAQRALGDRNGAAQTAALIDAIDRIGNAYRVSDRLLSVYYAEHGRRLHEAYAIAKRELAARDDVFTEDTLAWAAAKLGRWDEAARAAAKATRYNTEDARLQFHAGMIALHFGKRDEARRRLATALAINPQFHATYADQARLTLAALPRGN